MGDTRESPEMGPSFPCEEFAGPIDGLLASEASEAQIQDWVRHRECCPSCARGWERVVGALGILRRVELRSRPDRVWSRVVASLGAEAGSEAGSEVEDGAELKEWIEVWRGTPLSADLGRVWRGVEGQFPSRVQPRPWGLIAASVAVLGVLLVANDPAVSGLIHRGPGLLAGGLQGMSQGLLSPLILPFSFMVLGGMVSLACTPLIRRALRPTWFGVSASLRTSGRLRIAAAGLRAAPGGFRTGGGLG